MEQQLQTFLIFLKQEYRYSDNTVAAYRNDLTQFFDYLRFESQENLESWAEVTPKIINQYVATLKESLETVCSFLYCPKSCGCKIIFQLSSCTGYDPRKSN